jgi:hypothetical protein
MLAKIERIMHDYMRGLPAGTPVTAALMDRNGRLWAWEQGAFVAQTFNTDGDPLGLTGGWSEYIPEDSPKGLTEAEVQDLYWCLLYHLDTLDDRIEALPRRNLFRDKVGRFIRKHIIREASIQEMGGM